MKTPKTYTLLPASAEDVYMLIVQFGPSIATIMIAGTIEGLPFPLHPRSAELPAGPIHVVKTGEASFRAGKTPRHGSRGGAIS
jgi:hypothetical protein